MGETLHDRIIHVESHRWRGHWWQSGIRNGGKWVGIEPLYEPDTYYTQWSQFLVNVF